MVINGVFMYTTRMNWRKILYLVFFIVFACCTAVTAVGDHSEGQNDDSNAKFSNQNSASYTYEINK